MSGDGARCGEQTVPLDGVFDGMGERSAVDLILSQEILRSAPHQTRSQRLTRCGDQKDDGDVRCGALYAMEDIVGLVQQNDVDGFMREDGGRFGPRGGIEDFKIHPIGPVTALPDFEQGVAQEEKFFRLGFDQQNAHKGSQYEGVRRRGLLSPSVFIPPADIP